MKRDMNLVRELLLRLEAYPYKAGSFRTFDASDAEVQIPTYQRDEINYHLQIIADAGLIETGDADLSYGVGFKGLTWEGHDFIDSIRDQTIWDLTQDGLNKAGGFSIDLVKALAKGFIKKAAERYTGVEIDF